MQALLRYVSYLSTRDYVPLNEFREFYSPNIDPAVYPPSVVLPSVHNTIIESLWRWLREQVGFNLKDAILRGKSEYIFHAHIPGHQ